MKSRTLISVLILIMAVLVITGSCATGKKAVKAPVESVYGTWVNPDYNTTGKKSAKLIYKPDGTCIKISHTDITMGQGPYKYTIPESWMDSDGKKYYKVDFFYETEQGIEYYLMRLNETDSVLEFVWSNIDYPTKIDPEHMNYLIYYRQ